MRPLFLVAAFVSSSLLFVIEPMAAKMILPTFGGAPQVWNTSLLFFQAMLLLGYLFAHLTARRLAVPAHRWVHVFVAALAALVLPISMHTAWFAQIQNWAAADKPPVPLVLAALAGLIGLPFFALSANSSTLQRWYSLSGMKDASEPWFLYSAGNVGSIMALLAYPILIEPNLTLTQQGRWWADGYLLLLVLLGFCAGSSYLESRRVRVTEPSLANEVHEEPRLAAIVTEPETPEVTPRLRLSWLALAAVPSSLLLGVTTYLTSNIAPIPLLWVVPLALYLITFILVFARQPIAPLAVLGRVFPLALMPLMLVLVLENTEPVVGLVHLAVFFVACWMCHSRLASLKPSVTHLTEFYFYISLGGVLGGAFNALIAPVTLNTLAEYPLALVAAALLMPRIAKSGAKPLLDIGYPVAVAVVMVGLVLVTRAAGMPASNVRTFIVIGLPIILCFLAVDNPIRFGLSVGAGFLVAGAMHVASDGSVPYTARSFFGVHRILVNDKGRFHKLVNGNTIHGIEDMRNLDLPLTYYHPTGPIGQVMRQAPPTTAAFVGLGVGSLAAYGHPGQSFTYYEIDPIVARIANDPYWFTFLHDSKAKVSVVLGDARLELAKSNATYDLIVLDAFSSDAIPIHLLTTQAIQMYLRHLNPNGMLAFHISNRFLSLEPILSAAARDLRLIGFYQDDAATPEEKAVGKTDSQWAVMARDEGPLSLLTLPWWDGFDPTKQRAWTDDYSDVISAFNPNK